MLMRPLFRNRWPTIMRRLFFSWILAASLAIAWDAPLSANAHTQPVAEEKKPEPPKVDGSSQVVYYALAATATLIIVLLICMPARRE